MRVAVDIGGTFTDVVIFDEAKNEIGLAKALSTPGSLAQGVLEGFTRRLKSVPDSLRQTLTYDQGSEMALHRKLAERLRIDIYFCDPRSPWQRGSNENANGLVREYLPKGTDLSQFSHQQLTAIERSLNNRPRKILGFRTPAEVFTDLKINDIAGVALEL